MTSLETSPPPEKLPFAQLATSGPNSSQKHVSDTHEIATYAVNRIANGTGAHKLDAYTSEDSNLKGEYIAPLTDPRVHTSLSNPPSISTGIHNGERVNPPSMDGKSYGSCTTFAMDEKESIRPDDSASMKAAIEDEESASQLAHGGSGSSDPDVRAFQEQLDEISSIEPISHTPIVVGITSSASLLGPHAMPRHLGLSQGPELLDTVPDVKLLEALEHPRDRIWVLKLEQDIIDFVKSGESSLVLPQCNAFYRMLAHKIADYYMLGHAVDETNSAVRLHKLSTCRVPRPLTGVITPSTAASTPPPSSMQMKILRRGIDLTGPAIANGSNGLVKGTSENGESGTEDDHKKAATREEREAKYQAARLRIMGSAKPVETPEVPADESRSSSATGKRKKKHRTDSNDDFEARSAYNSYAAPIHTHDPHPFSYPGQTYAMPLPPYAAPGLQQGPPQMMQSPYWYQQPAASMNQSMMWPQSPSSPYDLSREFDRSMSLHQQNAQPIRYMSPQQQYQAMPFDQQIYGQQPYPWPQQMMLPPVYGSNPSVYAERALQPEAAMQADTYAFGQLPSQALGRPPNPLEHPLPGSYKSRHFNPQSQTFVPIQGESDTPAPYIQHALPAQRPEPTAVLPSTGYTSPSQRAPQAASYARAAAPLTHPLPQPVFASQQHHVPTLPARPPLPQHGSAEASRVPQMQPHVPVESSISRWPAPASLPAKPPPPSSLESGNQSVTAAPKQRSTAHIASPRMPIFGSMTPS